MIYNEGNQGKDQKIQASHHKPPQKFAASLTLARKKSGKKGYNDINPGDADGHDPLGEGKSVEQQGQQKKIRRLPWRLLLISILQEVCLPVIR